MQHNRNLAGYHTVIAIFFVAALMAFLYDNNVIKNISVPLCCRIIVWSLGFFYAAAYSIIKRLH